MEIVAGCFFLSSLSEIKMSDAVQGGNTIQFACFSDIYWQKWDFFIISREMICCHHRSSGFPALFLRADVIAAAVRDKHP